MPWMAPVTFASAGAMTTLNRIGVISGTMISRGVWALRAKRRLVKVASGAAIGRARRRVRVTGAGGAVVMAVMGVLSRSGGEAVAGQPQIHVVERRRAGADAAGGDVQVGDGSYRLAGRTVVDRHGERCAHGERVLTRQPS